MTHKTDDLESIVQIDDPEIDVQEIMARIREGLIEHALDDDVEFPTFAVTRARRSALSPSKGGDSSHFSKELYYQLEQANLNYDQIWVELSLIESRMPLVGRFINRFKRELHRLVVYYANMLGERQVTMNDALVRTLNQLVESLELSDEAAPSIEALQRELADLRARLERLEAQMNKSGD
jgi:predicted HicB family RNase H-like nuclease